VIQSAIDACTTGGNIFLKAGTYVLTESIFLRESNIALQGAGWSTKFFLGKGVNKSLIVIDAVGANKPIEGICLSDFALDGNRAENTAGHCIFINADITRTFFSSTFRNLRLMNAPFAGLCAIRASELMLTDIHAGWCFNGIELHHVSESEINAVVSEGYQDGIQLIDSRRLRAYIESEYQSRHGIYLLRTNECYINFIAFRNRRHGVVLEDSHFNTLNGVSSYNSQDGDGLFDGINLLNSNNNLIEGVVSIGESGIKRQRCGIREEGTSNFNIIALNNVSLYNVTPVTRVGANTEVKRNVGYISENSGTATIPAGATSVTVAHGLAGTPRVVKHCPRANLGAVWVSARDSVNITLNVAVAPTVATETDWEAEL